MEDFAATLVTAREKAGLTQANAASAAGLTPSYLCFIENRKKPPPSDEVCRRLAEVLGLPAQDLIELAHLERSPETVQRRIRSLRSTVHRERRSRLKLLGTMLSPYLFAGPKGFLDAALDLVAISPRRRRRLREALAAVGRHHQDRAEAVADILEKLPERDRSVLLEALPKLLDEGTVRHEAGSAPTSPTVAATRVGRPAGGEGPTEVQTRPEPAPGPRPGPRDPPLLYGTPPPGLSTPFLLSLEASSPASAPEELRPGDLLLVDPSVEPQPGDLLVLRGGDEAAVVRRLEQAAAGYRLLGRTESEAIPDPKQLARRLRLSCAGTVLEIRRPLRSKRASPGSQPPGPPTPGTDG